jgi:Zn finger protein HypA/HybF involved in hydrogenase expression
VVSRRASLLWQAMTECRECAIQMKLVSVTQTDEGLEDRTFECPKCHERDTRVFNSSMLEQRA